MAQFVIFSSCISAGSMKNIQNVPILPAFSDAAGRKRERKNREKIQEIFLSNLAKHPAEWYDIFVISAAEIRREFPAPTYGAERKIA
ncbi:MAG: hypothetical protein DBX44_00300 [Oscillospiraceae bacterium]|nr:MAG: hypothetical protein DBX44_00300 [Oscillospiraceae bacterium]